MKIQKMKIPAILGALLVAGTFVCRCTNGFRQFIQRALSSSVSFQSGEGWISDPSGIHVLSGKYHMYWWGKVESQIWYITIEITPYTTGADDNISYFTGSTVIDKNNTASFGKGLMYGYTVFEKDSKETGAGHLSSHDGKTFHYYEGNPVLDLEYRFRDPDHLLCRRPKMGDGCSQRPWRK